MKKIKLILILSCIVFQIQAQLPSQSCHDDLFAKQAENKFWGYVDLFDEWRVEPIFTKVYPFTGNKAVVEKYGQYGVANCSGKLIIPAQYEEVGPLTFSEYFWAKRGGKWSLVNEKGELTAPGHVIDIKEVGFNSEATWIQLQDEKYGLYDKKTTRFLAAARYAMFQILSEKASIVQFKEKFGVVSNTTGEYLFEPVITSIRKLTQQVIVFQEKGKWGILNPDGEVKIVAEMDSIGFILNNLFYASKNKKAGLIDSKGKLILPLEYEEVNPFYDHMSLIKKDGKYGYTTLGGRVTIPVNYEWGDNFQNGQAIVKSNSVYFIIDKNNKKISETYKWLVKTPSRNYYAANRDGKYLFLDLQGKEMMEPKFSLVVATDTNEFVRVQNDSSGLWGYYNITKNKMSFEGGRFKEAGLFKYKFAFVRTGPFWGVINEQGKIIVQPAYDKIDYLINDKSVFFLVTKGGKKGLLQEDGTVILSANFDLITSASKGFLKVKEGDKYNILTIDGKEAIKTKYDFISNAVEIPFIPEWPAIIQKKKDFGLLAQNLTEIVKPSFESISYLGDNFYLTVMKGKKGIINANGKVITANYLDQIKPQSDKALACELKGKWGFLLNTGKMLIEPIYEDVGDYYKNLAAVKKDGKWGVINKQGKVLLKNEFNSVQELPNNTRRLISPDRTIEITEKGIIKQID